MKVTIKTLPVICKRSAIDEDTLILQLPMNSDYIKQLNPTHSTRILVSIFGRPIPFHCAGFDDNDVEFRSMAFSEHGALADIKCDGNSLFGEIRYKEVIMKEDK